MCRSNASFHICNHGTDFMLDIVGIFWNLHQEPHFSILLVVSTHSNLFNFSLTDECWELLNTALPSRYLCGEQGGHCSHACRACVFGGTAVIEVKPAALTAPAWLLMDAHIIAHAIMDVDAIMLPARHYLSV